MLKKVYWGFSIIVLIICATLVTITIRNRSEIEQLKQDAVLSEQKQPVTEQPILLDNNIR